MSLTWFRNLTGRRARRPAQARRHTARPRLEALETRLAPAIRIWDGVVDNGTATANSNWNNRFNWVGDIAPVAGDEVRFPQVAQRKTGQINDLPADIVLNAITYEGSGYSVLSSSNRIILGPGGFKATHTIGSNTFGAPLRLNATRTFDSDTTFRSDMVISGVISGSGGMNKTGAGGLSLTAANLYSGLTSVTEGTLSITNNTGLGSTAAGTEVSTGATVEFDGALTVAEAFTLNSTGVSGNGALRALENTTVSGPITLVATSALGANIATVLNITGVISGPSTAGLQKVGAGGVDLSAANTYAGPTTVSAGNLRLRNASALGSATNGTTVQAGGTLVLNGLTIQNEPLTLSGRLNTNTAANTWNGNITVTGDAFVSAGLNPSSTASLTIGGDLDGTGNLTKDGPNVVTITGNGTNSLSGTLTVADGTLRLNTITGTTFTPSAFQGDLVIGDGVGTDTVILLNHSQISLSSSVTINSSGTLNLNGFNTSIDELNMVGGRVTTGAGTLTLSGDVTATSAASNDPSLIEGKLSRLASSLAQVFTVNNGLAGSDLIVSAVISGSRPLTKEGAGRMELTAANTYGGVTTVNAGFLRVSNAQALSTTSGFGSTVNNGGTLEVAGAFNIAENLTLNGAGAGGIGALVVPTIQGGGTAVFLNPITLASNTTVRTDGLARFSAAVGGTGNLTKVGTGQLTLSVANSYTGQTNVNEGTLVVNNAGGLGSTTAGTTVAAGATLNAGFVGAGTSAEPLTLNGIGVAGQGALFAGGSATFSSDVILASNARVAAAVDPTGGGFDGSLNLAGSISGPFEIEVQGAVTFSGTAANTHAGTRINSGLLTLNKTANTNAVPGVLIIDGGTSSVRVQSAQQIADNAPVTINGTGFPATGGSLLLGAAETLGPLTLNAGAVSSVGGSLTLGDNVTASGSSLLDVNVSLGNATRTFTVAAGGNLRVPSSRTLSGAAGVGLIKEGPGQLQLDGKATYPGTTTVNAGTLFLGGINIVGTITPASIAGPVVVNSGGTLTGFGQVANLTLAGGRLDPAAVQGAATTPSILSAGGVVLLNAPATAASTFHVDLAGTTPGGSNGHDQLRLLGTGSIDLNNARLDVAIAPTFQSSVGSNYIIVRNDTPNDITTRFTRSDGSVIDDGGILNVPGPDSNGDGVPDNTLRFRVFYDANDGNDVMLFHESTNPMFPNRAVTPVVTEGGFTTLTGTIFEPDPLDYFILTVDWGDGSPTETHVYEPGSSRDVRLQHRYLDNRPGELSSRYTIRLSWVDQHGGGNSGTLDVVVLNANPSVLVGANVTLQAGQTLSRTGTVLDAGVLDRHTVTVDYGDGSGPQELNLRRDGSFRLRHRYERPGLYLVRLTVTDDDGGVGTYEFFVEVK